MSIFQSTNDLHQSMDLLSKSTPSYRKAYSDRTSWFMACASELAYRKFNPPKVSEKQIELLEKVLLKVAPKNKKALLKLLQLFEYDNEQELKQMCEDLVILKAELVRTFDNEDTQAILIRTREFLVLSFRGTESNSWADIKTDFDAKLISCRTNGRVHSGFYAAFEKVEGEILNALNESEHNLLPLFITGHSLGGALATVAAKLITHTGGNAACYTFGSPRVADDDWLMEMKTCVYRVVNAADGVTLVPLRGSTLQIVAWILRLIPVVGKPIRDWLLKHLFGYLHAGDMRFLSTIEPGAYQNARLLTHVDIVYRARALINRLSPFKSVLTDHYIAVYRRKLAAIALQRNR
ncbi:lipase family protein [Pseudidiomarina sp. 1APP75-32.1]|uniref:Lipase family protein n=1 Tax=Pseudidiomarina terrestris TaxID=2820060 RepID=A0AAW7QZS5_9GAMM|nr:MULTISPECIES: lipase family protein [unclassified Pseudidiomarina]MDN7124538.1 lipase family protein [Pseudidiomarina sp. 1APP75-32.1]MDN7129171.1 lipase family protein [Pseudidiomarina sp. 1APR75-15]